DKLVTGVQTCALPISLVIPSSASRAIAQYVRRDKNIIAAVTGQNVRPGKSVRVIIFFFGELENPSGKPSEAATVSHKIGPIFFRSEERRVGKEGSFRW